MLLPTSFEILRSELSRCLKIERYFKEAKWNQSLLPCGLYIVHSAPNSHDVLSLLALACFYDVNLSGLSMWRQAKYWYNSPFLMLYAVPKDRLNRPTAVCLSHMLTRRQIPLCHRKTVAMSLYLIQRIRRLLRLHQLMAMPARVLIACI